MINKNGSIADYDAYSARQEINTKNGKKAGHPGSDGSVGTSKDQVASDIQRLKDKKKQLKKQNKHQSQDSWFWY